MGRHQQPKDAWLVLLATGGLERFQFGEDGAGLGSRMAAGHYSPSETGGETHPRNGFPSLLPCAQIPCFPTPADKQASGTIKTFYFYNSNCLASTGLGRPLSSAGDSSPESGQARIWVTWPHAEALLQVSMTIVFLALG